MNSYILDKPDNLVEIFERTVATHGHREWLGTKDKTSNTYQWVTYREAAERINSVRSGFHMLGVRKNDSVAIIDNNSVEWAVCCYAAYGLGARFVPMYKAELEKTWKYIVTDSDAKILIVRDMNIYNKVKGWVKEISTLEHIIVIDGIGIKTLADLEYVGRRNPVAALYPRADDIAGLIYTSGTTGEPKGVLLSHGNFTSNVHASCKAFHMLDHTMRTLSFLPWAHSYGQTAELNFIIIIGGSCGFAESPKTILEDLQLVKPNVLIAVPRIFNRVYDTIIMRMNEKGGIAKLLFNMGISAAKKIRVLEQKKKSDSIVNAKLFVADKIVFSKIRKLFGGNLKLSLSSSASMSPHIAEFFFDINLPVYDAWGMTELSPAGSMNTPGSYKIGSSGKPIDKVRFVIDKSMMEDGSRDGELVVYGPNVMKGYYKKPKETSATMTEDGGLRTGDRAFVDEDGYLYITGRIKEQFKLENGKFVYPAAIEDEIKILPYIEQAMIYGLNRPYTICLIYPDFIVLDKYARDNNLPADHAEMIQNSRIKRLITDSIVKHLEGRFGTYEIPKQFLFLSEGFTVENGFLTQTFKLKRSDVLKRYQSEIDQLYRENRFRN